MRCPVCKADNPQGPLCRRCKADLELLFTLEQQRARLLASARAAVAGHCWSAAGAEATVADWLRSDAESLRLRAVVHLLERDFARAWECYRLVPKAEGWGNIQREPV
jgi:hypothetical protein